MASVINTNMASLFAQKNLSGAQNALSTSVERLSSGLRINRAKDDAAGLGISEKIKSQVTSLNQGLRNANDAISMVQTAEGSLSEVSSILQRMKELSVQARNDSLSTTQRSFISDELVALKNEINSISERTTFNDLSLLKNALRTQVAVPAAADSTKLVNGASLLDGLTVSNLKLNNVNAGTYSFSGAQKTVVGSVTAGTSETKVGTINSEVSLVVAGDPATDRTVDLTNLDTLFSDAVTNGSLLAEESDPFVENNKITLTIAGVSYSMVVGSTNAGDDVEVAQQMLTKLLADYPPTTAEDGDGDPIGTITLDSGSALGIGDISLKVEKLARGNQVQNTASSVNRVDLDDPDADRVITIADFDVIEGREFVVRIGNPEQYIEYSVIAGAGDTADSVGIALEALIGENFVSSEADGVITIANDTGMSNISVSVYDTTVSKTLYSEVDAASQSADQDTNNVISAKDGDDTARTIQLVNSDMVTGRTVSVTVGGKEYAAVVEENDDHISMAYKLADLIGKDFREVDPVTNAVTTWVTEDGAGEITFAGQTAELGLDDIKLEISSISNPGVLKIVADMNTSIGGTSQTLSLGVLAAGSSKTFDFDHLGISFTLTNSRDSAVDADAFSALTSKVSQLAVEAAMDGEALFQVGAGTRDNVVLDGFKDIRMTGHNQNVGAEKEVFDKVYETLTTIAANTTESLSEANFATLENRIEDAITMVSDFRSYFGGQQNRIEFAIANIQAQSENLTAANSRIVDTDYAAETANLTKTQIMQQAATAMLAQANQMPNVILALLK